MIKTNTSDVYCTSGIFLLALHLMKPQKNSIQQGLHVLLSPITLCSAEIVKHLNVFPFNYEHIKLTKVTKVSCKFYIKYTVKALLGHRNVQSLQGDFAKNYNRFSHCANL